MFSFRYCGRRRREDGFRFESEMTPKRNDVRVRKGMCANVRLEAEQATAKCTNASATFLFSRDASSAGDRHVCECKCYCRQKKNSRKIQVLRIVRATDICAKVTLLL